MNIVHEKMEGNNYVVNRKIMSGKSSNVYFVRQIYFFRSQYIFLINDNEINFLTTYESL